MYKRIVDLLIGEGGPPAWDESNRPGNGTYTPQRFKGTTAATDMVRRGMMTPAQVDKVERENKSVSSEVTKARLEFRKKKAKKP